MEREIINFISSPTGIFFIVLNPTLAILLAFGGIFVLRSLGKTLESNSKANALVLAQSSELANTANEALKELTRNMAVTIETTEKAVTIHNQESALRHQQELDIQKTIADTLSRQTTSLDTQSKTIQRQTELMSSQVTIMNDMSDSEAKTRETIETKIAPSIEVLRVMMTQLLQRFENYRPEEVMQALVIIQATLDNLTLLVKNQSSQPIPEVDKPAAPSGDNPPPQAG